MPVAFTFLRAFGVIEAGRERQVLRVKNRKPGEYGVALNSCRIFPG